MSDQLELEPAASNGQIACLFSPNYPQSYELLRKYGLQTLGVDFYLDVAQADGRRLPSWRSYHHIGSTSWPCAEQAETWSFIAHGAFQEKNGLLWDVASRIRHQLRVCDWRLRQISECYRDQLRATLGNGEFVEGRRFSNGFTWLGYLAIQSFLVDACVLRDYFAEYRALILLQAGQHKFTSKVTRMGSLKKQYLNRANLTFSADQALADATEAGGWLRLLGSYRNLVVHFAPLASAGSSLYAICVALRFQGDMALPSIKLPIPPDPEKISESRASGTYWDDSELNYARFLNALANPVEALDGLQYAHSVLGHLATLAIHLGVMSPVKPKERVLTEKDIINIKIIGQ